MLRGCLCVHVLYTHSTSDRLCAAVIVWNCVGSSQSAPQVQSAVIEGDEFVWPDTGLCSWTGPQLGKRITLRANTSSTSFQTQPELLHIPRVVSLNKPG